jgi:hypothetical protein
VLFLGLPFVCALLLTAARTPDDALITLRYAWNLVHGHGAVFNRGDEVQGFSSPLHLLVSSVVVMLPGGFVLAKAKFVSILFGALAVGEGARLLWWFGLPRWAERVGMVMIGGSLALATSAANGLESSLFAWLVVVLVYRLVTSGGRRVRGSTALVAAALVLTRPEGIAIVVALAAVAWFDRRDASGSRPPFWALGGVAALLGQIVVSVEIYGVALPNTFYAKREPVLVAAGEGVRYLASALQPGATLDIARPNLASLLLVLQCVLLVTGVAAAIRRGPGARYLVAAVAAQCAFAVTSGGDWMHGGRFLAPVVILVVLVEVFGVVAVASHIGAGSGVARSTRVAAGCLLALVVLTPFQHDSDPVWRIRGADDRALLAAGGYGAYTDVWVRLPTLVSCVPRGGTVASTEVGYLGWSRLDLSVLDLRGLTDRAIAHGAPAASKHPYGVDAHGWGRPDSVVGARVRAVEPSLVVLLARDGGAGPTAQGGDYVLRRRVAVAGETMLVYVRRDAPVTCQAGG